MKRAKAVELISQYWDKPVFGVRIGICSPQAEGVTFTEALVYFDDCDRFTAEYYEYVYIYAVEYIQDRDALNDALRLFNLGLGRANLNKKGCYT